MKVSLSTMHKESSKRLMSIKRFEYINSLPGAWILISPSGEIHHAKSLKGFCDLNNLSYSALRKKSSNNDGVSIKRGKSSGWSLYGKSKI